VLQEHGVCWAELGDFVEAAADEVAGYAGVAFRREVGGVAVYDCLGRVLEIGYGIVWVGGEGDLRRAG
jgi:hypothetical protein